MEGSQAMADCAMIPSAPDTRVPGSGRTTTIFP